MDAREIIRMGKTAVRNNAAAYSIYQTLFQEAFGFIPECPTCGSINGHKHWAQFEAVAYGAKPETLILNKTEMSKKTFEIKNKSRIYSYTFEAKTGRQQIARIYGDVMTEEFAKAYIDSAKDDENLLAKRKAEFLILPGEAQTDEDAAKYPEKLADKKALAAELGYPEDEYADIKTKADMDIYLDTKADELG